MLSTAFGFYFYIQYIAVAKLLQLLTINKHIEQNNKPVLIIPTLANVIPVAIFYFITL